MDGMWNGQTKRVNRHEWGDGNMQLMCSNEIITIQTHYGASHRTLTDKGEAGEAFLKARWLSGKQQHDRRDEGVAVKVVL